MNIAYKEILKKQKYKLQYLLTKTNQKLKHWMPYF